MAPPDWIKERDVFAAGSHDSPGEFMGLGRFQRRLAEPKLRSFLGLDEACKRWDQQDSEAMDQGLEDLESTTIPHDDTKIRRGPSRERADTHGKPTGLRRSSK